MPSASSSRRLRKKIQMRASPDTLNQIHEKIAKAFLNLLNQSEGKCPACDHEIHVPLTNPAVYGHIIKFMKDNNIEALPVKDSALGKIKTKLHLLPFLEPHERVAEGE